MRVEVFKGKGRILPGWYYRVRADNGRILTVSEGYVTKWNAKRAARKLFPMVEPEVIE
jgi:uncharacterized protein YegP (UPF0339 family)